MLALRKADADIFCANIKVKEMMMLKSLDDESCIFFILYNLETSSRKKMQRQNFTILNIAMENLGFASSLHHLPSLAKMFNAMMHSIYIHAPKRVIPRTFLIRQEYIGCGICIEHIALNTFAKPVYCERMAPLQELVSSFLSIFMLLSHVENGDHPEIRSLCGLVNIEG